jgi:preprotein translocase subunit SecE
MSKDSAVQSTALWQELFQFSLYKPTQGKIVRQVSGAAFALIFIVGAWRLFESGQLPENLRYVVPSAIAVLGSWISFRVVNWPSFADFLIGVEAEMNKVTWPSWDELKRSSMVVMALIFGLTVVLFAYDLVWHALLKYVLGVVV